MQKIAKDILKCVKFSNTQSLKQYIAMANQFLCEHNSEIRDSHDIFETYIETSYHDEKSFPISEYNETPRDQQYIVRRKFCMIECKRVIGVIDSVTSDKDLKKSLFLFYILYFMEWRENNCNFRSYIEVGFKGAAKQEQERAECERKKDNWEKISVKFAATKARLALDNWEVAEDMAGKELFKNGLASYLSDQSKIEYAQISWDKGKSVYKFEGYEINSTIHLFLTLSKLDAKSIVLLESLCNSDMKIEVNGGEVFALMKKIMLVGLKVTSRYKNFGEFTDKRKTIIKDLAVCLYPIHKFLIANKSAISIKFTTWKVIQNLLDLKFNSDDAIAIYLGKGVSEKVRVWHNIGNENDLSIMNLIKLGVY